MRHRKLGRKLNRNSSHRKAMFKNMANALFRYESIQTTLPKAKELRRIVEPIITKSKNDTVNNRRYVFNRLRDDEIVAKLFVKIGIYYKERDGGYIRILKNGYRTGDKAPMALVQLVGLTDVVDEEEYIDDNEKEQKEK